MLDTLDKLTVQFLQKGSEAPEEVLQLLNWFEQGVSSGRAMECAHLVILPPHHHDNRGAAGRG